jgi:hypothetical protein
MRMKKNLTFLVLILYLTCLFFSCNDFDPLKASGGLLFVGMRQNLLFYFNFDGNKSNLLIPTYFIYSQSQLQLEYETGIINQAAKFNSSKYEYLVGSCSYLRLYYYADNYPAFKTISLWIKLNNSIPIPLTGMGVFSTSSKSAAGLHLGQGLITTEPDEIIALQTNTDKFYYWTTSKVPVLDINWHHFLFVWSESTIKYKLFFDGIDKGEGTPLNAPSLIRSDNLFISQFKDGYFDGAIDEFGIWARCLTEQECDSLYNGGKGRIYPFFE